MFSGIFAESIVKRAINSKKLELKLVNLRDFGAGKHKNVDDKPYGKGTGMILKVEPTIDAIESIKTKSYKILLSASGKKYSQKEAKLLSKKKAITLICGHYEGVDARVEKLVDNVYSIGDFILTGGEIGAMVIVDSVTRLIPGVIKKESLKDESFSQSSNFPLQANNLLEYPQYTRPEKYRNLEVPKILLSGDHNKIAKWQKQQSLKRTKKFRPDLIKSKTLK